MTTVNSDLRVGGEIWWVDKQETGGKCCPTCKTHFLPWVVRGPKPITYIDIRGGAEGLRVEWVSVTSDRHLNINARNVFLSRAAAVVERNALNKLEWPGNATE